MTYKVVRYFFEGSKKRTLETGFTLEQAQECTSDPESSWKTCTSAAGKARTRRSGMWFDGYTKEG